MPYTLGNYTRYMAYEFPADLPQAQNRQLNHILIPARSPNLLAYVAPRQS